MELMKNLFYAYAWGLAGTFLVSVAVPDQDPFMYLFLFFGLAGQMFVYNLYREYKDHYGAVDTYVKRRTYVLGRDDREDVTPRLRELEKLRNEVL